MGGSFKIIRLFGIDVIAHWSFFFPLAFFAFLGYRGAGNAIGALVATAFIAMLFLSVLLHEYGHSLVAQRLGTQRPPPGGSLTVSLPAINNAGGPIG